MKIYFCLISVFLFTLSSCSTKLPVPESPDKGIVAIPLKVTNSSHIKEITREYYLTDYRDKDVGILIRPTVGQKFAFSQPLEPGDYRLYRMTSLFTFTKGNSGNWKRTFKLPSGIYFSVEAGKVTVTDQFFTVSQVSTSDRSWDTKHGVEYLSEDQRQKLIEDLKKFENGNLWQFAD